MSGEALRNAREASGLSQQQAAEKLGASQALLSLMEKGKRSVTFAVALKAVKLLQASPEQLPVSEKGRSTDDQLAADLGALGYPGYGYLSSEPRNPAEVLFDARAAGVRGQRSVAEKLYDVVAELRKARLAKNDTLCQSWWPASHRRYATKSARALQRIGISTRESPRRILPHSVIGWSLQTTQWMGAVGRE
jgi:transcriptional regulator with XRE-family HTH domain